MHRSVTSISRGAVLVAFLGLVFVIGGATIWVEGILPEVESSQEALYEFVVHILFGLVILGLGIHIERSELSAAERRSILVWCFGGFLFLFVLAIWSELHLLRAGEIPLAFASNVVFMGSMGGAFGAIAGVNVGRARHNRNLAEENAEQRETLELLTRLLGHDIRNDVQLIQAHIEMLSDHVEESGRDHYDFVNSRSETIMHLLRDVDTLVKAIGTDREFAAINLSTVLHEEATKIRENHPDVSVVLTVEGDLTVMADKLISQLFANLFSNAVNHNDEAELEIEVIGQAMSDSVEVIVRDNGDGIPSSVRVFDLGKQGPNSEGDGIGLYLVSRLATIYGGSVTAAESPEGGAEFTIELPSADVDREETSELAIE